MAVANGTASYTPPKLLQQFEKELSFLPLPFVTSNDILLLPSSVPSNEYVDTIHNAGFDLPKLWEYKTTVSSEKRLNTPKNEIRPWGWSPAVHQKLLPFKTACSPKFLQSVNAKWNSHMKELYSRKTARFILKRLLEQHPELYFLPYEKLPTICYSIEDVNVFLQQCKHAVFKAPWSSSGRGLLVLRPHELKGYNLQWLQGVLQHQKYVMAEHWLQVVLNIGLHFQVLTNQQIQYLGYSTFTTNYNTQYAGNNLKELKRQLSDEEKSFLSPELLLHVTDALKVILERSTIFTQYEGFIGIDALLYRDEANQLRIQPCLEMNMRYNMGLLALELEKKLAPSSYGELKIERFKAGQAHQFHEVQKQRYPLKKEQGLIKEGYLSLIPVEKQNTFGAWIQIEAE